jgi:hypothetical protein
LRLRSRSTGRSLYDALIVPGLCDEIQINKWGLSLSDVLSAIVTSNSGLVLVNIEERPLLDFEKRLHSTIKHWLSTIRKVTDLLGNGLLVEFCSSSILCPRKKRD